jgi:hypothetical protein
MSSRTASLFLATALLAGLWGLDAMRDPDGGSWVRAVGANPGPVRILRFYASAGSLTKGEKALLCYGVVNAKSVRISPTLAGIYPAARHCVVIVPEHTTHYTILAEGFDGRVAMQSLTLPVQAPPPRPEFLYYANRGRVYSTAAGSVVSSPVKRS